MAEQEFDMDKLIASQRKRIDQLRESVKDVIDEKKHDDIFLLRYCLSFKTTPDAEKALRKGIEYRKKNESWLQLAVTKGEEGMPHREIITKHVSMQVLQDAKVDGGPVSHKNKKKTKSHL